MDELHSALLAYISAAGAPRDDGHQDSKDAPAASLAVSCFLSEGGSFEELAQPPYCVTAKRHGAHPNLVCLHYSHRFSDAREPIVRECRGLVLDEDNAWRPVCCPYYRFDNFDATKHRVAEEDWSEARVYKKLDGTLVNVYWFGDRWHAGTSSTADGTSGVAPLFSREIIATYSDFFWQAWEDLGYRLPSDKGLCYMFELQSPQNQVVVPIDKLSISLHGARNLTSLQEMDPRSVAEAHGWVSAEEVRFPSMLAVQEATRTLGCREEGYVVVLPGFRRYKVKSPSYVLASLLPRANQKLDVGARRNLLAVVAKGEAPEFSAAFPHLREALAELELEVSEAVDKLEALLVAVTQAPGGEAADGAADPKRLVARGLQQRRVPKQQCNVIFKALRSLTPNVREAVGEMAVESLDSLLQSFST